MCPCLIFNDGRQWCCRSSQAYFILFSDKMTFFSRLGEKKAESLFSNLKGWEKFFFVAGKQKFWWILFKLGFFPLCFNKFSIFIGIV
jgi:hypothetical protein